MNAAMIFDIVLLVVLISTAMHYAGKGFLAGIVHFIGNLLSLVAAWILSAQISPAVFENFFKNSLVESTRRLLQSQADINVTELVERYAGFLPGSMKQNIIEATAGVLDTSAPDMALLVVEKVITPLLVPIISVVVFFITFALCRLLVSLVSAMLSTVNHIPLLGTVNRWLGFASGIGVGAINVILLLCAAWAAVLILGESNPYWNEAILSKSWFYQLFAPYNPFL